MSEENKIIISITERHASAFRDASDGGQAFAVHSAPAYAKHFKRPTKVYAGFSRSSLAESAHTFLFFINSSFSYPKRKFA